VNTRLLAGTAGGGLLIGVDGSVCSHLAGLIGGLAD